MENGTEFLQKSSFFLQKKIFSSFKAKSIFQHGMVLAFWGKKKTSD